MSSVAKALTLLEQFSHEQPTMGISELARNAGLSKTTAFRLMATLLECGWVERTGLAYRLSPRLAQVAGSVEETVRHRKMREVALPHLQELYVRSQEVVHFAVLSGSHVRYVEKLFGHNAARSPSQVGGAFPATCSALGKAMVAFNDLEVVEHAMTALQPVTRYSIVVPGVLASELQQVRREGVAFDREEAMLGLQCVAAPILGPDGRAVAAVSVSGPTHRVDLPTLKPPVVRAARNISAALRQL